MRDKIVIYQKPTCSKCRATLSLLKESGEEFESINYYEVPLTADKLRELIQKLNLPVRDILRKDEPAALDLSAASDDEILAAMVRNPDLIQRPIVERGAKAVLARPAEKLRDIL